MNCPKCGNQILPNSKFCTTCGEPVNIANGTMTQAIPDNNETQVVNQTTASVETTINQPTNSVGNTIGNNSINLNQGPLNFLMYIIAFLLKPFKCYKEESLKLESSKNSLLLTAIVSGGMMLINLITTIFSVVRTEKWTLEGTKTVWEFDNLKNLNYVDLILKNYLIYIVAIFAIGAIMYVASLIIKKDLKFFKSLSIAASSIIPLMIGCMILSPILSLIYAPLGMIINIVAIVYSIVILMECLNNELQLTEDKKIYFFLIILGIIIVAGYYLYMEFFAFGGLGSELDELNNILDMFG